MNVKVKQFVKDSGIFFLGSFGSKFLTFFLLPVYTTVLTTGEYGEVDLVVTTQSLLLPVVTLSLAEAIFRFIMIKDIDDRSVLTNCAIIVGLSYTTVFMILSIANIVLKWDYIGWVFLILAFSCSYDILTNYLKAKQKAKKFAAIGILFTFTNLICNIVFLVVFAWRIKGYLLSYVIAYGISSFVVFFGEGIYKKIRIQYLDTFLVRRMLKYSFPLIFTTLSWWIIMSSDRYMIKFFMTSSDVGIYSIAAKIPSLLQALISILQTVWQISTNQIHDNEPEKLKENFVVFMRAFRQIGFITGSALILITQPLMFLVARNDFYNGWIYVPFLALSVVFSFSTGMVSSLYGAFEKNEGVLYSVLIGGTTNIILNAIMIPRIGVIGATISTAISRLIIAIYRLKDTEKLLEFDREYGKVAVNCILITIQAVAIIVMKEYVYSTQIILFIVICVFNKEIILKLLQYTRGCLCTSSEKKNQ